MYDQKPSVFTNRLSGNIRNETARKPVRMKTVVSTRNRLPDSVRHVGHPIRSHEPSYPQNRSSFSGQGMPDVRFMHLVILAVNHPVCQYVKTGYGS